MMVTPACPSSDALHLVRRFEGLRLDAYRDVAGVWTIGYGHTGPDVVPGMRITEAKAEALLASDLARFEGGVRALLGRQATARQLGAFVSLAYNIGLAGLASSTALARHDDGAPPGAVAEAITWWDKATVGGALRALPGLRRRREAEAALYLSDAERAGGPPDEGACPRVGSAGRAA